ncbi:hypothetical protein F2Q70_00042313 [Brassica cretica]|uniref:Uncharacterized protein n=1 Tax=Brassica cretica TaxID=69181 RepID=A0A8S9KK78_BRACR|nr:hypothetical protein F2Q70_00042313 [Brassica cretica]
MQQGHTATDDDLEQFNLECIKAHTATIEFDFKVIKQDCRNRTTKRTSNGRELERVGVEVARADRCRYQKDLRVEADRMTTSWNACKNRLGFVGLGFKVVD